MEKKKDSLFEVIEKKHKLLLNLNRRLHHRNAYEENNKQPYFVDQGSYLNNYILLFSVKVQTSLCKNRIYCLFKDHIF